MTYLQQNPDDELNSKVKMMHTVMIFTIYIITILSVFKILICTYCLIKAVRKKKWTANAIVSPAGHIVYALSSIAYCLMLNQIRQDVEIGKTEINLAFAVMFGTAGLTKLIQITGYMKTATNVKCVLK